MSKEKKNSGLGKFVLGAAIGAGLGILFAPKSGKETRKELKEKLDILVKKVKEIDVKEVRENLEKKIEEIKKELSELDKEKVAAIAKEKAEVIKEKCEELVQLAVDKGTPVLEKAAKEVREKTIDTMKDTIKKLEAKDKVKAEK